MRQITHLCNILAHRHTEIPLFQTNTGPKYNYYTFSVLHTKKGRKADAFLP